MTITLLWLFLSLSLQSQSSTFDTSNEGWRTNGDPSNNTPGWLNAGGNPAGYIRGTDAAQGGIWYFVAPQKFIGNHCESYGKHFSWDQNINTNTNPLDPGGAPDLLLKGAGLTLAWDNPVDPATTWTHYDVLLREDAGWHLNDNNGPVPTQVQFMAVLNDLYILQIRGEYRYGVDFGGLDNVILGNTFSFDLDGDNSSGGLDGNFFADSTCATYAPLADLDAIFLSEKRPDSIVCQLQFPQNPSFEILESLAATPNIGVSVAGLGQISIYNLGGATLADFLQALHNLQYRDNSPVPFRGIRIVSVKVYTECGLTAECNAYLPIFPPVAAGDDAEVQLCQSGTSFDLNTLLTEPPAPDAYWKPALPNGNLNPGLNSAGVYAYIVPAVGTCVGDTALVNIAIEEPFQLPADTVLCRGDTLWLPVPSGLKSWQWSTGSRQALLPISQAGSYTLEGQTEHCSFSDEISIQFYQCSACQWYAPNVFSPNDDGWNDCWQVFRTCESTQFELNVFDRWGNLVFHTTNPSDCWDSYYQGKEAPEAVYVWQMHWTENILGQAAPFQASGNVTLVKF